MISEYDLYGNQTSITDPQGRITTFEYDYLDRQTSRTLPPLADQPENTGTETFTYDALGRQHTVIDMANRRKKGDILLLQGFVQESI